MKLAALILTGTMLALGIGLTASPARAQFACDLNGLVLFLPPPGTDNLLCGTPANTIVPINDLTAVGVDLNWGGNSVTIVGSNGFGSTGGLLGDPVYAPPAVDGVTAIGSYAVAAGTGSVAVGDQAVVGLLTFGGAGMVVTDFINAGTAIGSHSLVSADAGTAVGARSEATGVGASAFGQGSTASGEGSVALGQASSASAFDSVAVGFGTAASGVSSVAIGDVAQATAANSVALGAGSVADQANTVSVGTAGAERRITNVAAGVAPTDAANVSQLGAVTTNVTALQTQTTANTTAISTLQADFDDLDTRVGALEGLALDFAGDLDRVDDRAAAGTAAAMAMSGAMFLPGNSFNLTGNVAAYRGAVAGALQLGALVGAHAAVNAGVAHGFNKHGKTGVRAGFTFGW